jgi:hypothetical protein
MADRYLVATGNWNSTDTWSDESGGDPGASVPGSSDNVFLDANSGANTVLTVNVSSACRNFDCTGFTGTLAGTNTLSVWGTVFKLVAAMSLTDFTAFTFTRTSGNTAITTAGKTIAGILAFNGNGGTFQLQDKLTTSSSLSIGTGATFDANSQDVLMNRNVSASLTGAFTFYNLERKPVTAAGSAALSLAGNITVTNALTLDSNSTDADKRLLIRSDTRGTARTITAASVTANYCDFEDITGAGAASWDLAAADGGSGNCGGNSGITFTTPATVYQVGTGSHNFSADVWKTASNGATAARRPLPQDTAVLDASSTTGTMTQDLQRIGTISAAAFTGTLTTSTACACYGSITLGSGLTLTASTQTYTLAGRGTHTLTSAGKTWAKSFTIDAPGGSYTLQDALVMGATNTLTLTRGTFDANDQNVTVGFLASSNAFARTLDLGNGTWTLTGVSLNILQLTDNAALTLVKGTSLIKITAALTGPAIMNLGTGKVLEFYDFENATTGNQVCLLVGSATFNQVKVNPGRKMQFFASNTFTATSWVLTGTSGSPIELAGDIATSTAAVVAKAGGGTVTADYATITYLTGTPANTFYATNSTDGGNNTGWTFSAPPAAGLTVMGIEAPAKVNGVALPLVINGVS